MVRWEKVRGHVRFEFLCGARALRDHAWRTEALLEAAKRRTIHDRELIEHLERAAGECDTLKQRRVHLDAEDAPAAGPACEHHPGGAAVKAESGRKEVMVRRTHPAGDALHLHDLAAAHPAQRVQRVYAVVHHVAARAIVRLRGALVALADGVGDGASLQALLPQ